jgi:hypothetical protein
MPGKQSCVIPGKFGRKTLAKTVTHNVAHLEELVRKPAVQAYLTNKNPARFREPGSIL